jgi:hypothetical protein
LGFALGSATRAGITGFDGVKFNVGYFHWQLLLWRQILKGEGG